MQFYDINFMSEDRAERHEKARGSIMGQDTILILSSELELVSSCFGVRKQQ